MHLLNTLHNLIPQTYKSRAHMNEIASARVIGQVIIFTTRVFNCDYSTIIFRVDKYFPYFKVWVIANTNDSQLFHVVKGTATESLWS